MLLKKEVFCGKREDSFPVISALKEENIRAWVQSMESDHLVNVNRGAGVGRYGESTDRSSEMVSIYVKKNDFEVAQTILARINKT